MTRSLALSAIMAVVVAGVGGCGRSVKLVVDNPTQYDYSVLVSGPGVGVKNLGRVGKDEPHLEAILKIESEDLPTMISVAVGTQTKRFRIDADGPEVIRLYISLEDGSLRVRTADVTGESVRIDRKTRGPKSEVVID